MIKFKDWAGRPLSYFTVVLLTCLLLPSSSFAGAGISFKLPMGKRIRNGIIAEINTRWVDGFGHRPIRIRLSVQKANRDRTISVRLFPNSWSESDSPLTIATEIEIPQGEKSVTKTVYAPHDTHWNWMRAEFYENGKKLKDLSMKDGVSWNSGYYNSGEIPCVLMVDSDAPSLDEERNDVIKKLRSNFRKTKKPSQNLPNVETIQFLSISQNTTQSDENEEASDVYRDIDSLTILQTATNMELLPPADLPTSYVGLGSIDLIVMSIVEIQSLQADESIRFKAIDDYVRNGGNLLIFGEQSLQQTTSELFSHDHLWKDSDPSTYNAANRIGYYDIAEEDRPANIRRMRQELREAPGFHIARHGLGRIVVSDAEDPFQLNPTYWRFINQTIGSNRLSWTDRHGIALDSDNSDFWDFLIPGYGATPVVSFLSLITLFVLCIGPLNFFLLKKVKRFYLLPFTVVLAAIVTTSVMMTYAFLSDGVERRVRLRSFTDLDQTTTGQHVAATHCRHAYLAAVAPTNGLVFSDRVLAYPIVARYESPHRRQRIRSAKQTREFHQGYIGSRSTTQFLTTEVQDTSNSIEVTSAVNDGIQTVNKLGVKIQHAWIVDSEGVVWYSTACEVDGKLELTKVVNTEARKQFDKIMADNRPKPPDGLQKANYKTGFMGTAYSTKSTYADAALLNSEMSACANDIARGTPNTYIVITHMAPSFVQQGLSAIEEAGFHVIRGRWSR